MDKSRITYLIQRYLEGVATAEELRELESALSNPQWDEAVNEALDAVYYRMPPKTPGDLPESVVKEKIFRHIVAQPRRKKIISGWPRIAAAAAVLALVLSGAWIFTGDMIFDRRTEVIKVQDLPPGGNRATLTLADGRKINLDQAQSGIIMGNGIAYPDGTEVVEQGAKEQVAHDPRPELEIYNLQLSTPKGGTYQVTLPDGSRVWLNAASTLTYPSRFAPGERVVEIAGEGYFAVTKDENRPFKVISRGQEIEVLGTEFNVSAYPDDAETKTTLVEGSVHIASPAAGRGVTVLKPGQQSTIGGKTIHIQEVDTRQYTSWKDGRFYFNNTSFKEMMRQISRWYDVEVVYTKQIPQETFTGEMRRSSSLMTVLELLNVSAVHVRLEERKLIVD